MESVRRLRTNAKGAFNRAVLNVKSSLGSHDVPIEHIDELMDDVKKSYKVTLIKHENLVGHVDNIEEEDTSAKWAEEVENIYRNIRLEVIEHKKVINKLKNVEQFRKSYNLLWSQYQQAVTCLDMAVTSTEGVESIKRSRDDVVRECESMKGLFKQQSEVTNEDKDKLSNVLLQFSKAVSVADAKISELKRCQKREEKAVMNLQRVPLPKFDGNARSFPRFMKDFENLVMPNLPKEQLPLALRQALPTSIVNTTLGACDDDVLEMMKVLKKKFGDSGKIVEEIVNEIKWNKKLNASDQSSLVTFVNLIERASRDLVKMDMKSEISNMNVISMIINKLPDDLSLRWYRKMAKKSSSITPSDKFDSLLTYLQVERDAVECKLDCRKQNAESFKSQKVTPVYSTNTSTDNTVTCVLHPNASHLLCDCFVFQAKSGKERLDIVRERYLCVCCLKGGHKVSSCRSKQKCETDNCNELHNKLLHGAYVEGLTLHTATTQTICRESCILLVMGIAAVGRDKLVNVMWDSASTVSLITFDKARELNLTGKPCNLTIIKTGGCVEELQSFEYTVLLKDIGGKSIPFIMYGIPEISTKLNTVEVDNIVHYFHGVNINEIQRPVGFVDILVGMDYAAFHPKLIQSYNHLVLYENRFGKCIGGRHEGKSKEENKVINLVYVNHVNAKFMPEYFEIEALGVECSPKCGSCKCGKCPPGGHDYSLKEERELAVIQKGLTFDGKCWTAQYPWKKDPHCLPDNKKLAFAALLSTEKRLLKDNKLAILYKEQMDDMVERGASRKLSREEERVYDGPIHYAPHHAVLNPESRTTPYRIVFNTSSMFHDHVLNEYWYKGPDLINNLLGVSLRFRENFVGMVGDIRKMYHSVKISEVDQHTHRYLWRDLDTSRPPDTYVMLVVSFGDRPAGTIAGAALRNTAEMLKEEHPRVNELIENNTYVDDILDSVDTLNEAERLAHDVETVLQRGGFNIKEWTFTGNKNIEGVEMNPASVAAPSERKQSGQKVLGVWWCPEDDYFHFKIKLNFSKKKRGIHIEPNLSKKELSEKMPTGLTRRMVLSQVNGFFDPAGLATAFSVRAKILMRHLWIGEMKEAGWDDPMPQEMRVQWERFFLELFDMETIKFKRCVKPDNVIADCKPQLILFSDGSEEAYGVVAYARWQLICGSFKCTLIASKCKVTPLKQVSIVLVELNGAVLAKRLKEFIVSEMRIQFSKIYFLVDSEIALSMIQRESYGFKTYAALRVGEIQRGTNPEDWFWIEGDVNIADWVTRGRPALDLASNGIWQNAPTFLELPESEWPIEQNCKIRHVPELVKSVMTFHAIPNAKLGCVIDIERFSSYTLLLKVTTRVLAVFKDRSRYSLKNIGIEPTTETYQSAIDFWVFNAQSGFTAEEVAAKYKRLGPQKLESGVWTVGSRMEKWLHFSYNNSTLPLLPYEHRFARLYAEHIHRIYHSGVSSTVAKIRLRYWVINIAKMVKNIIFHCVHCKIKREERASQIMAPLPLDRLKPAPAWHSVCLDYFGPFVIKGEANSRSRGKCFGIIFTCMITRAVHIDNSANCTTNGFLMVLRRFVSLRGYPSVIYSDNGSQLKSASKELRLVLKSLHWDTFKTLGVEKGTTWNFSPADAPWHNACAESLIKSTKRCLSHSVGPNVLSFSEMQTVLYETANLLNERPIGRHPSDPTDGAYLCPNELLLGRATSRVPQGPFKEQTNLNQRLEFVEQIVESFWKKMIRDYFPSLIIQQKWHTLKRNVVVGDIVHIQDRNVMRGEWKIGRISKVYPDSHGVVRTCEVKYKEKTPGLEIPKGFITVTRPVQRIIVIVPVTED